MNFKFIRNLIEAGYTDEEIEAVLKLKEEKAPAETKPEPKPDPKPDPKPKPKPEPEPAPEPAPDHSEALIKAISSLEQTIKASNLINSVLDTQNTKSADDILAEMLSPTKKGE